MNLLSNLQFSLYNIFELYKTQGKRWYGFSMLFAIFSSLASVLIATLFLFACYETESLLDNGNQMKSIAARFEYGEFLADLTIYTQLMMVLNISMYSIYLYHRKEDSGKITFGDFFNRIGSSTWKLYVLLALGGMLVSRLFVLLFTPYGGDAFSVLFPGMHSPLMNWVLSLIQLAVNTFPALLAFILVRKHLAGKERRYTARMARTVFAAFLILYFAVSNFSYDILNFITQYIFRLVLIPFLDDWLPIMFVAVLCLFILGIFYLGIAGATIFPFLYKPEEPAEAPSLSDEL